MIKIILMILLFFSGLAQAAERFSLRALTTGGGTQTCTGYNSIPFETLSHQSGDELVVTLPQGRCYTGSTCDGNCDGSTNDQIAGFYDPGSSSFTIQSPAGTEPTILTYHGHIEQGGPVKSIPIPYQGRPPYRLEVKSGPVYKDGAIDAGRATTELRLDGLREVRYTPPAKGVGSAGMDPTVRLQLEVVPLDLISSAPIEGEAALAYLEFKVPYATAGGDGNDDDTGSPAQPSTDPSGLPLGAAQRDSRCNRKEGIDRTGTVRQSCTWARTGTIPGNLLVKGNIHAYEFKIGEYEDEPFRIDVRDASGSNVTTVDFTSVKAAPTWTFLVIQGGAKTMAFSDKPFDMDYDWSSQIPVACKRVSRETAMYGGEYPYGCQLGAGVWYFNIAYEGEWDRDIYRIQMDTY